MARIGVHDHQNTHKPNAEEKPGYIRVDTVHQGDQDGIKGVYHINSVDEVTQYEVVFSCSRISESFWFLC
jgi:hypothetical protein